MSTKNEWKSRLEKRLHEIQSEINDIKNRFKELSREEQEKYQKVLDELSRDKRETDKFIQQLLNSEPGVQAEVEEAISEYWKSLGRELGAYEQDRTKR